MYRYNASHHAALNAVSYRIGQTVITLCRVARTLSQVAKVTITNTSHLVITEPQIYSAMSCQHCRHTLISAATSVETVPGRGLEQAAVLSGPQMTSVHDNDIVMRHDIVHDIVFVRYGTGTTRQQPNIGQCCPSVPPQRLSLLLWKCLPILNPSN